MKKYIFIDTCIWHNIIRGHRHQNKFIEYFSGKLYTLLKTPISISEITRQYFEFNKETPKLEIKCEIDSLCASNADIENEKKVIELSKQRISEIQNNIFNERKISAKKTIDAFSKNSVSLFEDEELDEYIKLARKRLAIGNPPKDTKGHLGDPINWIALCNWAKEQPDEIEIYFITSDKDFIKHIGFLESEFKILTQNRHSLVFKDNSRDIISLYDSQYISNIDNLCMSLNQSRSFKTTHRLIENLSKIDNFSNNNIEMLLNALVYNDQVRWIESDPDISIFYKNLYSKYHTEYSGIDWGTLKPSTSLESDDTSDDSDPF